MHIPKHKASKSQQMAFLMVLSMYIPPILCLVMLPSLV